MGKADKKLATMLAKCGMITESQRDQGLNESEVGGVSFTQWIIEKSICSEDALVTTVASEMNYYPINLAHLTVDSAALETVTEEQANNYQVLPLARMGKLLTLAICNPFDVLLLDDLKIITGCDIIPVMASETGLKKAIEKAYRKPVNVQKELNAVTEMLEVPSDEAVASTDGQIKTEDEENENSAPIVKLGNRIIEDAYTQGSSDIHIEPSETAVVVRYRIDGILREQLTLPKHTLRALISRIKIMSDLNISERRLPQDGRIIYKKYNSKFDLDLRVSTAPMNHGEKVVMRILDKTKSCLPLDQLGFSTYNMGIYRDLIQVPYGMILHCGPTGSGKSMTLYAALNEINSPDVNICTAEDPIEYTLPRLNQMQMKKDIGLTFASALRCYLRQDPDIILVGEIRDRETANISIEAALTGHVLFSTLHTNDAATTISRLVDMEIDPFMISSCLVCVCAQRLLRRLCSCKLPTDPNEEELNLLKRAQDADEVTKHMKPKGCPKCKNSGYKGRIGVHELLKNTDELRSMICRGGTADNLKIAARRGGMRTLFEDCMEKVKAGTTSLTEAVGTARPDEKTHQECLDMDAALLLASAKSQNFGSSKESAVETAE
ncbi:MAG TPA: ATPase, T2SS/T4P/T4SS family [Planctomycetota bacterium]|nr:ATPase, T2SS/T4P/T4SS family [Planctomycetota bacterium]